MSEIKIKLSVIVPFYNEMRYIGDCLDSLTAQETDGMEIICVDDGSTDGSMEIVEAAKRRDPRIRTHRGKHAGLGAARNLGLTHASGEYILFVDADDMLEAEATETLLSRAEKEETDILYFGGRAVYETPELEECYPNFKNAYERKIGATATMAGPKLLARMHDAKDYKPSVALQMYSKGFLDEFGLRFHEGIIHEDALFSFAAAIKACRAAVLPERLYIRRVREDSIMTAPVSFVNVYGYYVVMRDMLRLMDDGDNATRIGESEYPAVFDTIRKMCDRGAKMYAEAGEDAIDPAGMRYSDRALMELTVRASWRNKVLRERNNALREKNKALQEKLSLKRETIAELRKRERELRRLKGSFSYRLGRALTAIPRKIRKTFRGG
jgi:glycosyltransferase involved in cell wall biosynthesis